MPSSQVSRDIKLTKVELRRIFRLTMPSMVFSGLAIALILADAGLAAFLGLIRNSGKYKEYFQYFIFAY